MRKPMRRLRDWIADALWAVRVTPALWAGRWWERQARRGEGRQP